MIRLKNGYLIESVDELPDLTGAHEVFLDVETRNYIAERMWAKRKTDGGLTDDDKKLLEQGGFYPFGGDRICGVAVCVDDDPKAYYVPLRHIDTFLYKNLELGPVLDWLRKIITTCDRWVNHHVNFDAQFLAADNVFFECELACTLTLSKIIDSDRLFHDLKTICPEYLGYDVGSSSRLDNFLSQEFSAVHWYNYAKVPIDLLAEYACDDVLMNRLLYKHLLEKLDPSQYQLWATEKLLTAVLFDMEYNGLTIDKQECRIESFKSLNMLIKNGDIIQEITGIEFTNSVKCIYDILINQFGMPLLATKIEKKDGKYIDTGRPTFDKDAIPLYEVHPMALSNPELLKVIEAIKVFKTESQFKGMYPDGFVRLADENSMIHPTYNQTVRTGRMSAKRPNSQGQNMRSKALIHPREGFGFMSRDYSQIEFRLIAHYIKDMNLINAYNNDSTTDFHQWVADLMYVTRKVGKTLNFATAYGAGERKVVADLIANPDVIKEISLQVNKMLESGEIKEEEVNETFKVKCKTHAKTAFDTYHEKIPGLRETSRRAMNACKMRGYIFNAYGRRRHLPSKLCYKAFNSLIQSCAMDLMKERMVALAPRYNKKIRDWGIRLVANVHDEVLLECPIDLLEDKEVNAYIKKLMESPSLEFRIPIYIDIGISTESWADAGH